MKISGFVAVFFIVFFHIEWIFNVVKSKEKSEKCTHAHQILIIPSIRSSCARIYCYTISNGHVCLISRRYQKKEQVWNSYECDGCMLKRTTGSKDNLIITLEHKLWPSVRNFFLHFLIKIIQFFYTKNTCFKILWK